MNPACQDNLSVDMVLEFGGEGCPLEMGDVAGCAVRHGYSAWKRTMLVLLGLLFLPIPNIETEGIPDNAPNRDGRAGWRKW